MPSDLPTTRRNKVGTSLRSGVPLERDEARHWLSEPATPRTMLGRMQRFWQPLLVACVGVLGAQLWLMGHRSIAISVLGVAGLAVGLRLGTLLLRFCLSESVPLLAVARTMIEEALSTKLSVLLVVCVVLTLPVLPLLLDPGERLAYRVQFFLAWSLSIASVMLSLLSIALACRSVSDDIESNRIHMAFSKPLSRWEYLFGKWFGIALLDALLVGLLGIAVYALTCALASSDALDANDRIAVDEQVLTARSVTLPTHPRGTEFDDAVEKTIERIREDDPAAFEKDPAAARKRIFSQHIHEWHTVTSDVKSSFIFDGLNQNHINAPVVQLRLKPWAGNSGISEAEVRFALWLNERPFPIRNGVHERYTVRQGTVQTIDVPISFIDRHGQLKVTVANDNLRMPGEDFATSISFTPDDGMQVLHRVGGFSSNFCRGLLVIWAKLLLLTAAALAAGTWLGFPTAFLASLMVYVSAVANGFFADAVDIYTGFDRKTATLTSMLQLRFRLLSERVLGLEWWEAIKTVGAYVADGFLGVIPSFGEYDSISDLATGRVIPLTELSFCLFLLGTLYPLTLLAVGCLLLQRRDLVRASS